MSSDAPGVSVEEQEQHNMLIDVTPSELRLDRIKSMASRYRQFLYGVAAGSAIITVMGFIAHRKRR